MIRIVLLGQPLWCGRLAAMLNERRELRVHSLAGKAVLTPTGLRQFMEADLIIRVGFRPGAATTYGVLFDRFWSCLRWLNRSAAVVFYWIGTDVKNSLQDFREGRLRVKPHREAQAQSHWADAPWLVTELAEMGYRATFHPIPVPLKGLEVAERLPIPFRVLTYIPDPRSSFFGGPEILACARALPDVEFEVMGGQGTWVPDPQPNLKFLGWQQDVRPCLLRCSALVRLVAHDGLGGTVREALEAGRHVIYSHPMPHVVHVPYGDAEALRVAVADLAHRHREGTLAPNFEGRRFVQETYDFQRSLDIYVALCRAALATGGDS